MAHENVGSGRFEFGNDGPSVIVAGLDGSDTSMRAAAFAGGLARREGSRLVCVFVPTTPAFAAMAPGGLSATLPNDLADELRRRVEEGAAYHGVPAELVVRHGDPFVELTTVADDLRADMVVVGASTHAGHRLVGSLAVRLVRGRALAGHGGALSGPDGRLPPGAGDGVRPPGNVRPQLANRDARPLSAGGASGPLRPVRRTGGRPPVARSWCG